MTKKNELEYIEDMVESIQLILKWFPTKDYLQNLTETSKDFNALVRRLQVIGEAAKKVSETTKKSYPQIPWKEIMGTRDVLVHDYDEINYEILVDIVTRKLPVLLEQLQPLRLKLESQYYQALPE